jgi:formylglycine-generating enzyme required for sulfatase activity
MVAIFIAAALAVLASACGSSVETAPTPASTSTSTSTSPPEEVIQAPSCAGDLRCGDPAQSCCASPIIEGGTFNRFNDSKWPATVSSFRLDTFEVTVGRLRAFVEAYPGSLPKDGEGAHPKLPWSGWQGWWGDLEFPAGAQVPTTQEELRETLKNPYNALENDDPKVYAAWTDEPGAHESAAANNISWYLAFAFCAWDGGRLPTEAEWSYASVGGAEQRLFAWGDAYPNLTLGVRRDLDKKDIFPFMDVGSRPEGVGRFGQLDLGGNRFEWVLDLASPHEGQGKKSYVMPCVDCAQGLLGEEGWRIQEDSSFHVSDDMENHYGRPSPPFYYSYEFTVGIRCARDLP